MTRNGRDTILRNPSITLYIWIPTQLHAGIDAINGPLRGLRSGAPSTERAKELMIRMVDIEKKLRDKPDFN